MHIEVPISVTDMTPDATGAISKLKDYGIFRDEYVEQRTLAVQMYKQSEMARKFVDECQNIILDHIRVLKFADMIKDWLVWLSVFTSCL